LTGIGIPESGIISGNIEARRLIYEKRPVWLIVVQKPQFDFDSAVARPEQRALV
jgi:hypothetical protein